jgi:hypothetical protein
VEAFLLALSIGILAFYIAAGISDIWEDPSADKIAIVVGIISLILYWSK